MAGLEDFETSLKGIVAAQRRPQPKLTRAEITAIMEAVQPMVDSYESEIATLRAGLPSDGAAWYGYDNLGTEYTGDMKRDITEQWLQANNLPLDTQLLRATLGERGDGPRARGPVTFYTYPTSTGLVALWVAKGTDLPLLQGMVSSVVPQEEEVPEEE